MNKQSSPLLELKNLGAATVHILQAVGIHCRDDLEAMGAVEAYLRVRRCNIHASRVMLYALHGALLDVHWSTLSEDVKQQLLDAVGNESAAV